MLVLEVKGQDSPQNQAKRAALHERVHVFRSCRQIFRISCEPRRRISERTLQRLLAITHDPPVIPPHDLKRLARERLKDAAALLSRGRHDGAVYICGYVIELSLKARICRHLRWQGFPETRKEFEAYQSFRTHDLDVQATRRPVPSV